jgi:hypothetical protein
MDWKPKTWIEHSAFGVEQVREDRGDKLDIDFVSTGRKTILKSTELKPGNPPSPDFKFPRDTSLARPRQFKVKRPTKRPPLDFNHLVSCFVSRFPGGFEGQEFHIAERKNKEKAAGIVKDRLGKDAFEKFLHDGQYAEVSDIAKHVLRRTNLVYPIEKAKFVDAIEGSSDHKRFANALFLLLHDSTEMEQRFTNFCDLLSELGVNKWPIATYYQFLASDGRWMFMNPLVMKRMADSLKISLNYRVEPNWLTYSRLQELADRVELELHNRGLVPHSRIDVQGFIWASIGIEEGNYRNTE